MQIVNVKQTDLAAACEPAIQAVTLLMRRAYARDKIKLLQEVEPLLQQIYNEPGGHMLVDAALRYILNESGQQGAQNGKIILKAIQESLHGPIGDRAMSIADILKHEARQLGLREGLRKGLQEGLQEGLRKGSREGLQKGKLKGRLEGKLEKALEIARKMLSKGMSVATIAEITQLPSEDIKKLQQTSR